MSTAADRRHHERFPFASRLEVRPRRGGLAHSLGDLGEGAALAVALDVSVGGFGFRSELPLRVGDLISVTLPEVEAMSLRAELSEMQHAAQRARFEERTPTQLEIVAVVRHVSRDDAQHAGEFVIGAERKHD